MIRKFASPPPPSPRSAPFRSSASTPAAAWGKGGGFHFHGHHFHGGGLPHLHRATTPACATVWVVNRFGDLVLRTVNVCY